MQPKYALPLFAQLGYFALSLAAPEPTVTVPWVGYQPDYFQGYEGRVVGSTGDKTTYLVNCPPTVTSCVKLDPDLTFIAGPSTYDLMFDSGFSYTSSGCTFAGGQTPTTATCSYTQSYHFGTSTITRQDTYQVPDSVYQSIYTATLPIAGTGTAALIDTAAAAAATATAATPTATATAAVTVSTAATASAAAAATTKNMAIKASASKNMLVCAIFAGVALQLQL